MLNKQHKINIILFTQDNILLTDLWKISDGVGGPASNIYGDLAI